MKIQFLYPLCLRCESLAVRPSLFCMTCEKFFLIPRLTHHTRPLSDVNVDFLLNWAPQESDSLSDLVYLLKSRLSFPVWQFYIQKFVQLQMKSKDYKSTAIIPIPGSHHRKTAYHTKYFAKAWSHFSNAEILECLESQAHDMTSQKELTLAERGQVQMSFIEDFTAHLRKFERVILVDDIITSGHTLRASLMALKPHLHKDCLVEIKALFSRDKI